MKKIFFYTLIFLPAFVSAQSTLQWQNVDSAYGPLLQSVHVYFTKQAIDTAPFRAFYLIADLKDKHLDFTTDTTLNRRLTPSKFFEKNDAPLVVVNGTFFSFETNRNLNLVITNGRLTSYNLGTITGKGKDTFTYRHVFSSAIGIDKRHNADVAWLATDSSNKNAFAIQETVNVWKDSVARTSIKDYRKQTAYVLPDKNTSPKSYGPFKKWKMHTAIGGGPVLIQKGEIKLTNNEEMKFAGKPSTTSIHVLQWVIRKTIN